MSKVENNTEFDNKDFTINTLLKSIILSVFMFFILLFTTGKMMAISFIVGAIASILYFRMQVMYASTLLKKDTLSRLTAVMSIGRVFLIGAILYIVFKRKDLFDLVTVLAGFFSIQFFVFLNFAWNLFYKKKLILNHI